MAQHHTHPLSDLQTTRDRAPGAGAAPAAALVSLRWSGERPVVALSGEVDVAVAAQLLSLRTLLERHGQRAAVDASEVTFLDVAGLGALLDLAGTGGSLLVLRPSRAVLRLLDLLATTGRGPSVLRAGPREEAVVLREASSPVSPVGPVRSVGAQVPASRRPAAR